MVIRRFHRALTAFYHHFYSRPVGTAVDRDGADYASASLRVALPFLGLGYNLPVRATRDGEYSSAHGSRKRVRETAGAMGIAAL
ncbi:MAG: hypothetical protein ACLR23_22075 [Clostridia bacterium]